MALRDVRSVVGGVTAALVLACVPSAARADTTVIDLEPTLACSIELDQLVGDAHSCGGELLPVGEGCAATFCRFHRAPVRFDVEDALPAGATLVDAEFISVSDDPITPAHVLNVPWGEDVNWWGPDTVTSWSAVPGQDSPAEGGGDGDYDPTAISDVKSLVLDWISEEEPNYGVLFKVPTGTNNQDYVEITPRLRLEYSEPPAGA